MGTEKKENEVYYFGGDVFNRDSLYCYATADSAISYDDHSITTTACDATAKGITLKGLTGYTIANSDSPWNCVDTIATKADVSTAIEDISSIKTHIDALSARLAALEQPKKIGNELRDGLKTLKYNREVE